MRTAQQSDFVYAILSCSVRRVGLGQEIAVLRAYPVCQKEVSVNEGAPRLVISKIVTPEFIFLENTAGHRWPGLKHRPPGPISGLSESQVRASVHWKYPEEQNCQNKKRSVYATDNHQR